MGMGAIMVNTRALTNRQVRRKPRGVAFILALFVMAVCSMICVTILDTQMLQYASLRNTMDYDRARYLAEAAVQHALSTIEEDYSIDDIESGAHDFSWVDFPDADGQYQATVTHVGSGVVEVLAEGRSGQFTRKLAIQVKMGG